MLARKDIRRPLIRARLAKHVSSLFSQWTEWIHACMKKHLSNVHHEHVLYVMHDFDIIVQNDVKKHANFAIK